MENKETNYTEQEFNSTTESQKKKSKKGFYLKVVALALCCSILGGIVGAGCVLCGGGIPAKVAIGQGVISAIKDHRDFAISDVFGFGYSPFGRRSVSVDFGNSNTYIGVAITDSVKSNETPEGALIKDVEKGSPADKAGLQQNDIVTMVNNRKITSGDGLAKAVNNAEPGDVLTLTIYRFGTTSDVKITVGEQSIYS